MRLKATFYKIIFITLLSSVIFLSPVFAIDTPPPGSEPGAEATRFQEDMKRQKRDLEKKDRKKIEEKLVEEEKIDKSGPSFILRDIKVTGATAFTQDELKNIYKPSLDKKIYYSELKGIANAIKNEYKKRGYLTATSFVPQQDIKDGVVEIQVVEGKVGEIKIEGNKWFKTDLIKKYFHLAKGEIFDVYKLQKDLTRLNQNSDLKVTTVVEKGKVPETTDLIAKAEEKVPYHIGIGSDNKGSRLLGRYRTLVHARSTNATGVNDYLLLSSVFNARSMGFSLSYDRPLDTYGTKLGIDATYYKMKLGKEFKALDIEGETRILTPHLMWEIFLSEDTEIEGDVGFEIKDIEKTTQTAVTTEEQLTLLFAGFTVEKQTSFFGGSYLTFAPKMTMGQKNLFGATGKDHPNASRDNTGGFFVKYSQRLSTFQRMPFKSYLAIDSSVQVSSDTLPSSEQMQIGGQDSVRGYPEGDYLCDTGYYVNTEWLFPKLLKHSEPFLLFDFGWGRIEDTMTGELEDKTLMGVGAGAKFTLFNKAYLKLQWAVKGGDEPTSGVGPSTFYLSFQTEI
ncbi:MAG: ShlB/FhaC/HecB family hemolysin secretion/activation protein [Candidatus Omnitrophota bacterium]